MSEYRKKLKSAEIFAGLSFGILVIWLLSSFHAPSASSTQSDVTLFSNFHKNLMEIDNTLNTDFDSYNKAFQRAVQNNDIYGMYNSSKDFHYQLASLADQVSKDNLLGQPLINPKAMKAEREAVDALNSNIELREQAVEFFMKAIDDQEFKPSIVSTIQDSSNESQMASVREALAILNGYQALGIGSDKIDFTNGGVKGLKK